MQVSSTNRISRPRRPGPHGADRSACAGTATCSAISASTSADAPTGKLGNQDFRRHEWFDLRQNAGLQFTVSNASLREFTGGSVQMRGGFVLKLRDGSSIDLRDLTLRARNDGSNVIDLVSGDGKAWFFSDSLMFRLSDDKHGLEIASANLRMSQALANRIGVPEAAAWNLGDIAMNTQIFVQGVDDAVIRGRSCSPYPWPDVAVPNVPGAIYQADLFMQATQYDPVGCMNCRRPRRQRRHRERRAELDAAQQRQRRLAAGDDLPAIRTARAARSTPATSPGTRCSAARARRTTTISIRS